MPQKPTRSPEIDRRAHAALQAAADLILFCEGAEEAGLLSYARRARHIARETIWLAQQLDIEMQARVLMQLERDRLLNLWTRRQETAA